MRSLPPILRDARRTHAGFTACAAILALYTLSATLRLGWRGEHNLLVELHAGEVGVAWWSGPVQVAEVFAPGPITAGRVGPLGWWPALPSGSAFRAVYVPLWLPLAAAWIPTGLAWSSLRRRTAHPWLCDTCGYDLTSLDPADLCPECHQPHHLPD